MRKVCLAILHIFFYFIHNNTMLVAFWSHIYVIKGQQCKDSFWYIVSNSGVNIVWDYANWKAEIIKKTLTFSSNSYERDCLTRTKVGIARYQSNSRETVPLIKGRWLDPQGIQDGVSMKLSGFSGTQADDLKTHQLVTLM